jgi:hypothetical protein
MQRQDCAVCRCSLASPSRAITFLAPYALCGLSSINRGSVHVTVPAPAHNCQKYVFWLSAPGSNSDKRCSQRCCGGFACSVAAQPSRRMHVWRAGRATCLPAAASIHKLDRGVMIRVCGMRWGSTQGGVAAVPCCTSRVLERQLWQVHVAIVDYVVDCALPVTKE